MADPAFTASSGPIGSLYGGFQAGYNHVFASGWMVSLEGDVSFPNFFEDGVVSTRSTGAGAVVTEKIDYIATLRARFGYAFDRWLIYGTGGFAWPEVRFLEAPGALRNEDLIISTRIGWTLGAGVEIAFTPRWTARLEYIYDRFGSSGGTFPSGTRYQSTFDMHMLRVGLNHQLRGSEPGAPTGRTGDWWPVAAADWNFHGQFTLVAQGYPAFRSPYQGTQSLSGNSQFKNTTSATAFIGYRPWDGTEFYLNPEFMQGFGLSDTFGLAGYSNGEAQKSGFPMPRVNVARIFVRQTFGLGGDQETVEDGPNQLAGRQDISRITITAGKFAVTDYFDGNTYSHDPRTSFLNWNMYCCGSYDWTMDKISYTWGTFAELNQRHWAIRAGYFLVPTISNDNRFDTRVLERGQYIAELELRYSIAAQPGKLRLIAWLNRANAGSYSEALALSVTSPNYPDIALTRRTRSNYGFLANAEQAITDDIGLFSRISWNAGKTEKIGWTDTDVSASFGAVLKGTSWGRPNDRIGGGGVIEGLSPEARAYFAAGGLGILIGDGRLNYREEKVIETYYAYSINRYATMTADYQLIVNPAYNADRGPVSIFTGRLHAEF